MSHPQLSQALRALATGPSSEDRHGAAGFLLSRAGDIGSATAYDLEPFRFDLEEAWRGIAPPRGELVAGLVEVVRRNLILLSPEVPTAQVAAAALALEGEDGVTELLKLVTYDDFLVRGKVAAALSLARPSIRSAVPTLIGALDREPLEYVQRRIIATLGQIGGQEAIAKLEDLASAAQFAGSWDRAEEVTAALKRARGTDVSHAHPETEQEDDAEDDEEIDPWRDISPANLAEAMDRALIKDSEDPPSGRMLRPIPELSLRSVLRALLPWKRDTQELADEWLADNGIEETFFRLARTSPKRVVYCCVSSSMVSGCWGVHEFRLAGRGYLYFSSDEDEDGGAILGAWEPAGDAAARRAGILAVYAREWGERTLPPAMGEWASGDPALLQEAILRALEAEPEAWKVVLERLSDAPEPREASAQTVRRVARCSGAAAQQVRDVLGLLTAQDGELKERLLTRSSSDDERRIVVAVFVHCIAKDPFGWLKEGDS
jgi:hypothetical protein